MKRIKVRIHENKLKMWEDVKYSYAAASLFPMKILLNDSLIKHIRNNKMIPIVHLQLNPTNRCTRNCSYCSCSEREKSLELPHRRIMNIMKKAKKYGCQSVTITGGGEPLMHQKINEIIRDIHGLGIEIGLVSNGDLLKKLTNESLEKIRWCRISLSDYGPFNEIFIYNLEKHIDRGPAVDWSFSYVLCKEPEYEKLARAIKFANENNFTHVRVVSDLLDLENVPDMEVVKKEMERMGVDDRLVNYQGRKDFGLGDERCLISLLKPVIGADGYIYPCCGTQYALKEPSKDYEKTMRMGKDLEKLYHNQSYFNGSACAKCYYKDYNYLLNLLLTKIKHIDFV